MDTNSNQQRAGRQGRGGPARGRRGGNPGRGSKKSSPLEMIVFSPTLSEMLLKHGAILSVTFDGTEMTTKVVTISGDDHKEETLAGFLRSIQLDSDKKALNERLRSASSRMVSLGLEAPDFSTVRTNEEYLNWLSRQKPEVTAALNMSSDNFRAHMRAKKEVEPPVQEEPKSLAIPAELRKMEEFFELFNKNLTEQKALLEKGKGQPVSGRTGNPYASGVPGERLQWGLSSDNADEESSVL